VEEIRRAGKVESAHVRVDGLELGFTARDIKPRGFSRRIVLGGPSDPGEGEGVKVG